MTIPRLPKKSVDLATSVSEHSNRERDRNAPTRAVYRLAHLYMRGHRKFDVFDPATGQVETDGTILSEKGKRRFQSQELMKIVNDVGGRLSSLDVLPSVGRNGDSLSSIRSRATSQLVLDSITVQETLDKVQEDVCFLLPWLGCVGLMGEVQDHPSLGLHAVPTVIHPRELSPWPSLGEDHTQSRGIMRTRYVHMDDLKSKFGESVGRDKTQRKMEVYEQQRGGVVADPSGDTGFDPPGPPG